MSAQRLRSLLAAQVKRVSKVSTAAPDAKYRRAILRGTLPALEHQPVLRQLPPMAVVIDVGGNVGQFSLVARHNFPDAQLFSFEPLPEAGARLRAHFVDDPRFECFALALSDAEGTVPFHVTGADDSSSLLPVGARQVAEFPSTKGVDTLSVATARLDDVLADRDLPDGPMLLKVDTQGTELAVLRGAPRLLERATHVIVEVSFVELYQGQDDAADIATFLVERGWALRSVYDVKYSNLTREPIQADMLFVRRSA